MQDVTQSTNVLGNNRKSKTIVDDNIIRFSFKQNILKMCNERKDYDQRPKDILLIVLS